MGKLKGDNRPRIAVITVGRSDFSILRPLILELVESPVLDAGLWIGGAHFDPDGGMTINDIIKSDLPIWGEAKSPVHKRSEAGMLKTMSGQMEEFGELFDNDAPDMVVILGDRYEAVSAGLAAIAFNVPVCHLSGGSTTEGAIDDVFRHCLTQIASFHFCDLPQFAERIVAMGAKPETVFPYGALGLDGVEHRKHHSREELFECFGLNEFSDKPFWLVALHPETRNPAGTKDLVGAMISALEADGMPCLFTYPNADPGSNIIFDAIRQSCNRNRYHEAIPNLGFEWYYTAMEHSAGMVGNSSGGIIEAASLRKPVINIGDRQQGRFCGENVIHVSPQGEAILNGLQQANSDQMINFLSDFANPYGDGKTAGRIRNVLETLFINMA